MVEDIQQIIEWDDAWTIGVESIDKDHRFLVSLIQKLFYKMMTEPGSAFVKAIFIELIDYAKYHFEREEAEFEKAGFPLLDEHRDLHKNLIRNVLDRGHEILQEGNNKDFSVELLDFLQHWLQNHIVKEDLKFKYYLMDNDTKPQ